LGSEREEAGRRGDGSSSPLDRRRRLEGGCGGGEGGEEKKEAGRQLWRIPTDMGSQPGCGELERAPAKFLVLGAADFKWRQRDETVHH